MKCCGNCFGDPFLTEQIKSQSLDVGRCGYCGSEDVPLIEPPLLVDYFEPLIADSYTSSTDPTACPLNERLQMDWCLFDNIDTAQQCELLKAIFSDENLVSLRYQPTIESDADALRQWESFREELKHENRFFPKNIMDNSVLEELISLLKSNSTTLGTVVYRARIADKGATYTIAEMGKPPQDVVPHGRANPFGIPYLYTASDSDTAIAEVRPQTGEFVCVCSFTLVPDMTFIDLRNPKETISPFALSEDNIKLVHMYMSYLCRLGEELSFPIVRKDAYLEYLPSQYLCEFIKHCGYDGVVYRSALSDGINYAIFRDSGVTGGSVKKYIIDEIDIYPKEIP